MRKNYRSEKENIESKIQNFREELKKKGHKIAYYSIPLDYLSSEMIIEINRVKLIEPIFKNIIKAIKENPESLLKSSKLKNSWWGISDFPASFIKEIKDKREVYFIRQSSNFYFDERKKRFTQSQC